MITIRPSNIVVTTPPAAEPVTLAEAKEHLEVLHDDRDAMIERMITAAREYVELFTGRALITQSISAYYETSPGGTLFEIPRPPLVEVDAVFSIDLTGTETAIVDFSVTVPNAFEPSRLVVNSTNNAADSMRVDYSAGYGDGPDDVPEAIRNALLMYLGTMFNFREQVSIENVVRMPWGAEEMLRQYRVEKALA